MHFNLKLALLWTAYVAAVLGIAGYGNFDPRIDAHWWSAVPLLCLVTVFLIHQHGRVK